MQLNCMEYLNTHQINLIEKIESYEDVIFAQNHLSYEERLSIIYARIYSTIIIQINLPSLKFRRIRDDKMSTRF